MKESNFDLRGEYEKFREKYSLPEYKILSEDFDVEKLEEENSRAHLLRDIRRVIGEKLTAYMHFFEALLNPVSPPLFIFPIIRSLNKETKEKINRLYKEISRFQIDSMKLDTIYSEKEEAIYLKKTFDRWQLIKPEIFTIIEGFEKKIDENEEEKKGNYLG
jgi:hypothetical protein